jgi:ring-1,2-phenylacetyl-CoA epoxidase subunit PaaD
MTNSSGFLQQNPSGRLALPDSADPHHAIWELLEVVCDPEIPVVNLREMGVLRAIRKTADGLEVVITPTYSGCPALDQMRDDVVDILGQHGIQARVITQLAPAWSSDWMTDQAVDKLRAYGIAPPQHGATPAHENIVQFAGRVDRSAVACPQCQSINTTETSHFGSTACKAMYKCLDCMEPFDYFKPY